MPHFESQLPDLATRANAVKFKLPPVLISPLVSALVIGVADVVVEALYVADFAASL